MNDVERARRIDLLIKTMYEYLEFFLANDVKNISRYLIRNANSDIMYLNN